MHDMYHVNIMYTPEWVQVQGLCGGHHNLIRHYRRVKRIVQNGESVKSPHSYMSSLVPHDGGDLIQQLALGVQKLNFGMTYQGGR